MNHIIFDLQHFAEGAGAGNASGAAQGNAGQTGENGSQAAAVTGRRSNTNPLANVVYGKQENQTQADDGSVVQQNNEKKPFEELIRGEYKEDFDRHFQKVFNERHRKQAEETESLRKQMDSIHSVIDLISGKYGVDASDINALTKAIEQDDAYYEQEANEKGISVEQLKALRKLERENSSLNRKMQESMKQEQIRRNIEEWERQSTEVRKVYPDFDFRTESANPDFQSLVIRGIPVQTAYEVIHKDEIMQNMAQSVTQKISQNIQTRQQRPVENGISSGNGIITKSDVHKLTRADRAEIARRAARGERISF